MQHFIRQIEFSSAAPDFGFVVPTPSAPQIEEADAGAFERLRAFIPVEAAAAPGGARKSARSPAVTVIQQKSVAGFDVAVLEAHESGPLLAWLEQNGYEARPSFAPWLQPYIDGNWKLTAFKYSAANKRVRTKPVRLSFKTERPFFPYREPIEVGNNPPYRKMTVYFLGPEKVQAELWRNGEVTGWQPGGRMRKVVSLIRPDAKRLLEGAVPAELRLKNPWLTILRDYSPVRQDGDVYFTSLPEKE